ncbi:hypothetical protein PENSPDRAFT_682470 [Peniophora sp. CONT]|nr:hypothetical protein PENSPDRAFT_682470 [Peniophora sp. CONT]
MSHLDSTTTETPNKLYAHFTGAPSEVTAPEACGPNAGPALIWSEAKQSLDALEHAADAARNDGITANDPLRLLSFAQSAATRDVDGEFNADLHYAMAEMKNVVSVSQPSVDAWDAKKACTSTYFRALTSEDQWTFVRDTFELCCAQLSHHKVLARPLLALDTIFVLNNVLYEVTKYGMNQAKRTRKIVGGLVNVWNNMYLSRELFLDFDSVRWHLTLLCQAWTNVCWNLREFPLWGTDAYWLFFFLWMKQPKTEKSDALLAGMHSLDGNVGHDPFATLKGYVLLQRLYEIMKKATEIYGEDALLARFHEILEDETILGERLRLFLKHVSRYASRTLGSKLHSYGTLPLYLRASRRQQADGQWGLKDARALCQLAQSATVQAGHEHMQKKMMGVLIEEEHFMRDFMLPALRMGLENNLWISGGPEDEYDTVPEQLLIYLIADTAEMYKSSTLGSSGHGVMSALRTDVSPYWHRFDAVMQALPSRGYELTYRKQELQQPANLYSWLRSKASSKSCLRAGWEFDGGDFRWPSPVPPLALPLTTTC